MVKLSALLALPALTSGFHVSTILPSATRRSRPRSTTARKMTFDVAVTGAASAIDTFFQTQPYLSAFLTCSFKASAADFVAQSQAYDDDETVETTASSADEQQKKLDVQRNLAFIVYGGTYQGLFQEFLYSNVYSEWFQDDSVVSLVEQVAVDNLIFAPFVCLPIAYIVKALFTTNEGEQPGFETIKSGLDKYVEDVTQRGLLLRYWALWVPVQTLTFSVVPAHFRIAFVAMVSFFWMFILSTVSASKEDSSATTQEKLTTKTA